jgi:hypothetical protein
MEEIKESVTRGVIVGCGLVPAGWSAGRLD